MNKQVLSNVINFNIYKMHGKQKTHIVRDVKNGDRVLCTTN